MPVLETLALIGAISGGAAQLGGFAAGLVGGAKANEEAAKAQAYQEKWTERLYRDQKQQQTLQDKIAAETMAANQIQQRFQNDLALSSEARTNRAEWHNYMQNAANKYSDILNKSRTLRKENAAALQNR